MRTSTRLLLFAIFLSSLAMGQNQSEQPSTTHGKSESVVPDAGTEQDEILQLPAPDADPKVRKLDLSSGSKDLTSELGPLVINKDGTTSRITNWDGMNEDERERTVRILSRRNRQRMAKLKEDL